MLLLEDGRRSFADDDAGSHRISTCDLRHDRSVRHAQLIDAIDLQEPLAALLKILASPWTMLLLHAEGPKRFGELKRRLGSISTKTLTERLRTLEQEGWVSRHYEPAVPPQVTYAITGRVLELDGVMRELDRIAGRWYGNAGKGIQPARRSVRRVPSKISLGPGTGS